MSFMTTYLKNSWASSCLLRTKCLQINSSFSYIFIGLMGDWLSVPVTKRQSQTHPSEYK